MMTFHFLRSYWLMALLPVLLVFRVVMVWALPANIWQKVCDAHLLPHLLVGKWQQQQRLPLILIALAWVIAVIALAGPTWSHQEVPMYKSPNAQVLVMDVSETMLSEDIKPNRLARAQYKSQDLLKGVTEGQAGFVAFSGEAFVVSPLTEDVHTIQSLISELDPAMMPVAGTDLSDAMLRAASLIKQADLKQGHIILITAAEPKPEDFKTAKKLAQEGLRLSVLGIGTVNGAPVPTENGFMRNASGEIVIARLDESGLKKLASAGKGVYATYRPDAADVQALLSVVQSPEAVLAKQRVEAATQDWFDQGQRLLFLLLPIAALAFRRGWLESLVR